jgi:hypothetical protein
MLTAQTQIIYAMFDQSWLIIAFAVMERMNSRVKPDFAWICAKRPFAEATPVTLPLSPVNPT